MPKTTIGRAFDRFTHRGDEPLAVDHDWWWPEDSEKLSKAMKEMGWYTLKKVNQRVDVLIWR